MMLPYCMDTVFITKVDDYVIIVNYEHHLVMFDGIDDVYDYFILTFEPKEQRWVHL